jgi:hypothetical protein
MPSIDRSAYHERIIPYVGAEGSDTGAAWYIENVKEELDYPTEFFYNRTEQLLYYFNNQTGAPDSSLQFVATNLLTLFNILGTEFDVVQNVTFQGTKRTCLHSL